MAKTQSPPTVVANAKNCACGCGIPVSSKARNFRQGHDQRLVSLLANDLVSGTGRGLNLLPADAAKNDIQWRIDQVTRVVRERLGVPLGNKVYNAAMRAWELEGKRQKRADAKRDNQTAKTQPTADELMGPNKPELAERVFAETDPEPENTTKLGSPVRVRIGRWTYDATVHGMNQAGRVTAVSYIAKSNGLQKVATEGQFTLAG